MIRSEKEHGFIAVAFTPDEEVGRGVENFELDKFTVDYAFTIDGDRIDSVDYETFKAHKLLSHLMVQAFILEMLRIVWSMRVY